MDKEQEEAVRSLGYSDLYAFFRIILPQAVPHFFPEYTRRVIPT